MTTQFDCPDNHGKPHSFDSIGLCKFCLLYDSSQDKQVRQSEKEAKDEANQLERGV